MQTVSGKRVAILVAVVIIIAVAAAYTWLYLDYVSAPRQP